MTSYRDAAITLWGEAGAYAHDSYTRWLPLFPALPDQLPIVIGLVAYGKCLGMTRAAWESGPRITIFSSLFKDGRRHVDDTMVHEMLHAWLYITDREVGHDTDDWYDAINRLSPAVLGRGLNANRKATRRRSVRVPNPAYKPDNGKPKTVVRKVPSAAAVSHAKVAAWPVRPANYEWGAPIPCPTY